MNYFTPKGSDKRWSTIALGCWQLGPSNGWGRGPSHAQSEAAVRTALEHGITTFDTAEAYGDGESERRLGKALGKEKYSVAVISKIWPDAKLTYKSFLARLDRSLKHLKRDYVDLYLMHQPQGLPDAKANAAFCEIMAQLKDSGKAKLVGLSNFQKHDLKKMGKGADLFSFNEVCYNLLQREYEGDNLKSNQKHGLEYLAFCPLAQGLLTGRFNSATSSHTAPARNWNSLFKEPLLSKALTVVDVVQEVAEETGATLTQVSIAWLLHRPNIAVALVGSNKPEQITEFAKAGSLKLSAAQMKKLTVASDRFLKDK